MHDLLPCLPSLAKLSISHVSPVGVNARAREGPESQPETDRKRPRSQKDAVEDAGGVAAELMRHMKYLKENREELKTAAQEHMDKSVKRGQTFDAETYLQYMEFILQFFARKFQGQNVALGQGEEAEEQPTYRQSVWDFSPNSTAPRAGTPGPTTGGFKSTESDKGRELYPLEYDLWKYVVLARTVYSGALLRFGQTPMQNHTVLKKFKSYLETWRRNLNTYTYKDVQKDDIAAELFFAITLGAYGNRQYKNYFTNAIVWFVEAMQVDLKSSELRGWDKAPPPKLERDAPAWISIKYDMDDDFDYESQMAQMAPEGNILALFAMALCRGAESKHEEFSSVHSMALIDAMTIPAIRFTESDPATVFYSLTPHLDYISELTNEEVIFMLYQFLIDNHIEYHRLEDERGDSDDESGNSDDE